MAQYTHIRILGLAPIFSWSDVYALFKKYQYTSTQLKSEVTLMLVSKPFTVSAQPEVYALSVTDWTQFIIAINNDVNNIVKNDPKLSANSPLQFKIDALNYQLGLKLYENNEFIKVFLEQFGNHGIKLYKANQELTNWSELYLASAMGTVFEIPCN